MEEYKRINLGLLFKIYHRSLIKIIVLEQLQFYHGKAKFAILLPAFFCLNTGKVTSLVGKPRLAEAVGVLDLIVC